MGGGKKCPACEPPGLLPCKKANWLLYGRLGEGWQEVAERGEDKTRNWKKNKEYRDTSLLRRLQVQTLPDEAPPIGKIHRFSKMAITFEPLMGF